MDTLSPKKPGMGSRTGPSQGRRQRGNCWSPGSISKCPAAPARPQLSSDREDIISPSQNCSRLGANSTQQHPWGNIS